MSLFFIAGNDVTSRLPIHDAVFNMTIPEFTLFNNLTGQNDTIYTSNLYVGVLGCMDQAQFCNPNNGMCTALAAPSALPNNSLHIGLTPVQYESVTRLFWPIARQGHFEAPVQVGGAAALKASESLAMATEQFGLPDNQWEIEVRGWFETLLAHMQQGVLEFATGPANLEPNSNLTLFGRQTAAAQCSQQLISL